MEKKKELDFYVVSQDTAKWLDLKRDLELYRDRLCEMCEETFPDFSLNGGEFDTAFEGIHKFVNRGIIASIDGRMSASLYTVI